jgi:hypothetical protein
MRSRIRFSLAAVLIALALWFPSPAFAQKPKPGGGGGGGGTAPTFQVVPLASETGNVTGINDVQGGAAEMVGIVGNGSNQRPVYWNVSENDGKASVAMRVLPAFHSEGEVYPRDINNDGVIVGMEIDELGQNTVPLVWSSGNAEVPIVLPAPDLYAANDEETGFFDESVTADSISNNGLIVGQIEPRRPLDDEAFAEAQRYVIVWKIEIVEGEVNVLDMLWHDIGTYPCSPIIDESGSYVALTPAAAGGGSGTRATRVEIAWDEELAMLAFVPGSWQELINSHSRAAAVNDAGVVAGSWDGAETGSLNYGFAMDLAGNFLPIATLPDLRIQGTRLKYRIFAVKAVNNQNEALTYQWAKNPIGMLSSPRDAVTILGSSTTIDLNSYSEYWAPGTANRMNDDGWITGMVYAPDLTRLPALIIR